MRGQRMRTTVASGDRGLPILVIGSGDEARLAIRRASSPPFGIIEEEEADPALIRLIVSAVLFRRAGGRAPSSWRARRFKLERILIGVWSEAHAAKKGKAAHRVVPLRL